MSLSPEAIAICGQHYHTHGKGNGCHQCPIRDMCIADFALAEQNLTNWQSRVNESARAAILSSAVS